MSGHAGETGRLRELEQTLSDRALTLSEMADDTGDARLRGKAQGVDLALSFVQQAIRDVEASGSNGEDR